MTSKMVGRSFLAVMLAFLAALILCQILYAGTLSYNGTTTNVSPFCECRYFIERSIYFTDAARHLTTLIRILTPLR